MHIIGHGRYAREAYPTPSASSAATALAQILGNNRQSVGAASTPGTTIFFDSAPFTLQPDVSGGSPTVKVTGTMSLSGGGGTAVTYELVRDRGTGSEVVLETQAAEIGTGEGGEATITLVTLDCANATPAPAHPLVAQSTHTYSIRAAAGTSLTGDDNTLVLVEQLPNGSVVA